MKNTTPWSLNVSVNLMSLPSWFTRVTSFVAGLPTTKSVFFAVGEEAVACFLLKGDLTSFDESVEEARFSAATFVAAVVGDVAVWAADVGDSFEALRVATMVRSFG